MDKNDSAPAVLEMTDEEYFNELNDNFQDADYNHDGKLSFEEIISIHQK